MHSAAVQANSFSDVTRGVSLVVKAMTMHVSLLQRSDNPFNRMILLQAVRRDELLSKSAAAHHPRVCPRGGDQAVGRPQKERPTDVPEAAEASDQFLLQRRCCRRHSTASGPLPAERLSSVAFDDGRKDLPSVTTHPQHRAAQVDR